MKQTYLIQRLQRPTPGAYRNPFNFGGGLARGGLSEETAVLLDPMFRFDYMGAAEFEFGAVPKAFSAILQSFRNETGCTGTLTIRRIPVYYLCDKSEEVDVKKVIIKLSNGEIRLKERSMFQEQFEVNRTDYVKEIIGWLELDNGFVFFTDEAAFNQLRDMMIEYSTPIPDSKEEKP